MSTISVILIALAALVIGILIGHFLLKKILKNWEISAQLKAQQILKEAELEAENLKKSRLLEAKEKMIKLKAETEEELNKKKQAAAANENRIKQQEARIKQQEQTLRQSEQKIRQQEQTLAQTQESLKAQENELAQTKEELQAQFQVAAVKIEEAEKMRQRQIAELEKIANLSVEDARNQLIENLKDEAQSKAAAYVKQIVDEAKMTATKEARKLVLNTIQRTAAEHAIENCVSVFNLESDEIKGKIIGREGRNIRTLESLTGVELVVDDTPEAIIISGFDPVRREIARLALHRLVADGRIHPARIEEVVAKTQKQIEEEIVEIGERTVIELGISGMHPELIKMVGRMRFRSSYGQNLLQHSREVANLCATLAAELGLNAKLAKRAGLLHDIGKVSPEESEMPHALLGMKLAQRYKEHPEVCNAIGAHHDEIEMTSMISPIVQACDAISGSRPGARRETLEYYIKRIKDLETLAMGFKGVNKCFAMQAGRELRVLVDADHVGDQAASDLAFSISQKIEKEMQYPGQVKVTVIREMRAVSYAK